MLEKEILTQLGSIRETLEQQHLLLEELLDNKSLSPALMSQEQARSYIGVSYKAFRRLIESGMIKPVNTKKGKNGVLYYKTEDLQKLK